MPPWRSVLYTTSGFSVAAAVIALLFVRQGPYGTAAAPTPLSLSVPDGHGGWEVVIDNAGFPAGKLKTGPLKDFQLFFAIVKGLED